MDYNDSFSDEYPDLGSSGELGGRFAYDDDVDGRYFIDYDYEDEIAEESIKATHEKLHGALQELSRNISWSKVLNYINNTKFINAVAIVIDEEESHRAWQEGDLDPIVEHVVRILNQHTGINKAIMNLYNVPGVVIYKISNDIEISDYDGNYGDLLVYATSLHMAKFLRSKSGNLMEYDIEVYKRLKDGYDYYNDRGYLFSLLASPDNQYKVEILHVVFDNYSDILDELYDTIIQLDIRVATVIMCEYAKPTDFIAFAKEKEDERPINYIVEVEERSSNALPNVLSLLTDLSTKKLSSILQDSAEAGNAFIFTTVMDYAGARLTKEMFQFMLTSAVIGGNVDIINKVLSDKRLDFEYESGYMSDIFFYAINGSNPLAVSKVLLQSGLFSSSDFKMWLDKVEDQDKKEFLETMLKMYM